VSKTKRGRCPAFLYRLFSYGALEPLSRLPGLMTQRGEQDDVSDTGTVS
jgi:hypothetical protein